jgi:hypothetical protein
MYLQLILGKEWGLKGAKRICHFMADLLYRLTRRHAFLQGPSFRFPSRRFHHQALQLHQRGETS